MTRQRGFVPVIVLLVGLVMAVSGYVLVTTQVKPVPLTSTPVSLTVTPKPSALTETVPAPTTTISKVIPVPTAKSTVLTPNFREISVSGYAYEDRTDDGLFNSDDPRLPNMQFYLFDSYTNQQVSTVYSDATGNFSITLNVRGNLVIKPSSTNSFVAKSKERSLSVSTADLAFRFRSASAPVAMQNIGIIEGNVYQDTNKNLVRESGENTVYFYKLYLQDEAGNYFNTVENAQTTDAGGHFKFVNLPVPATYILRLSNPTGEYDLLQSSKTITLSVTNFQNTDVAIPVYKY